VWHWCYAVPFAGENNLPEEKLELGTLTFIAAQHAQIYQS
jgi:hypothetical protein